MTCIGKLTRPGGAALWVLPRPSPRRVPARGVRAFFADMEQTVSHPTTPSDFCVTTRAAVGWFFGVSVDTVKAWVAQGMPAEPRRYCLGAIVRWLRSRGPWRQRVCRTPDDLLENAAVSSPALDRYRNARAEREELELQLRKDQVVELEAFYAWYTVEVAVPIRKSLERLQREHGKEALKIVLAGIERSEEAVEARKAKPRKKAAR